MSILSRLDKVERALMVQKCKVLFFDHVPNDGEVKKALIGYDSAHCVVILDDVIGFRRAEIKKKQK